MPESGNCRRGGPHGYSLKNWPAKNVHCRNCGDLIREKDPGLARATLGSGPRKSSWGRHIERKDPEKAAALKPCISGHHVYKPGSFEREQKCLRCRRMITRQGRLQKTASGQWQRARNSVP